MGLRRRHGWRVPVSLALGLLVFAVSSSGPLRAETPRSVLVMAKALDDLITLDPAELFEFSGAEIAANLYQRLFRPNPARPDRPIGELVADWQVSDDRLVYRFTLRADQYFRSGRAVTAADAVYSLRRVVRLNRTPAFILTQLGLDQARLDEQIIVTGPLRFELRLDQPFAPGLVINALSATVASVIDSRALIDGTLDDEDLRHAAIGSGAYHLRRWQPGEYVILDRVPPAGADPGDSPGIRRVVLRDIREPATQRLLLEKGDIDIARDLGPDQVAAMAGHSDNGPDIASDITIVRSPGARLYYLALNQRHPALRTPAVRRAIRYLIDYHGIAQRLLDGHATVHQAFLPRGFSAALVDTPFRFDPARARARLAEAGFGAGLQLRMDVRADGTAMAIAQAIQASMASEGVALDIVPGDSKQVLSRYRARRHEIFFGQWGPDFLDPHSNASVFARNPDNGDDAREKTLAWRNGWDIPDLTRRTEAALFEDDPARRDDLYRQIQEEVRRDSPFVILFQEQQTAVMRASVSGFSPGLMPDLIDYRRIAKR